MDRLLGRGASGEVYACHPTGQPTAQVALKHLLRPTPQQLARLQREADILKRLDHPNIVRAHALHSDDTGTFLLMDLADGQPLHALVTTPPLPLDWSLHLAWQITDALCAAHQQGIFHRDVKPANAMVSSGGHIALLDFGIATAADITRITAAGAQSPATPAYAPLEWFVGEGEDWAAADAYGLGVLLWELIAGQRAFADCPLNALLDAKQAPLPPPGGPEPIGALVTALTHGQPSKRPPLRAVRDQLAPWRQPPAGALPTPAQTFAADPGSQTTFPPTGTQKPPPEATSSLGRLGRYTLLNELGRGGMGVVYRARDPELNRLLAVKALLSGRRAGAAERRRFLREARAVARLDHPNIVQIHDIGEHDESAFFTMQLVEGPSLAELLQARGALPPREAARIVRGVADGLSHAHGAGLIHRDVKPANVLLEDGQHPVLTDFGLVKEAAGDSHLTRGGQVLGTPAYMAPEQARGELDAIGPWTDQYALGVLLYELLAGQPPFDAPNMMAVIEQIHTAQPPPLRGVPTELAAISTQAMEKRPADRYNSVRAVMEDLERFLRGEPVLAARPSVARRLRAWTQRRWRLLVVAALAAIAAGSVGREAWRAWHQQHAEATRQAAAEDRRVAMEPRIAALVDAGEHAQADAFFSAFATFEDNAETVALSRAWLDQAARLSARGEDNRSALATAFALATEQPEQQQALTSLSRLFRETNEWEKLRTVLPLLPSSGADALEFQHLRRDLALSDRDVDTAMALTADGQAGLIGALSQATRTPWDMHDIATWDSNDGAKEVILYHHNHPHDPILVDATSPTLPLIKRLSIPSDLVGELIIYGLNAPDGSRLLLLVELGSEVGYLMALEGGTLRVLERFTDALYTDAVSADTTGDGQPEIYVANNRRLLRLEPDRSGGWKMVSPHHATNTTNSEIRAVRAVDTDGDGRSELLVGTGDWNSYDLRVFDSNDDGTLRLRAREKLGVVTSVRRVTRGAEQLLLALQREKATPVRNRRVFHPTRFPVADRGIHLFRLLPDRLHRLGSTPFPPEPSILPVYPPDIARRIPSKGHPANPSCDLDGDGITESFLRPWFWHNRTQIYRLREDNSFQHASIAGVIPLACIQADQDAAGELVVSMIEPEPSLWVLGVGTAKLPAQTPAPRLQQAPPPQSDAALVESWQRAEALAAMGLADAAASRLAVIARMALDTPIEPRAHLRAGQILEEAGDLYAAGQRYEQAATAPDVRAEALSGAQRCYRADRRLAEELAVTTQLQADDLKNEVLNARIAVLRAAVEAEGWHQDFSQDVDPRIPISHPLGARWNAQSGGLLLSGTERLPALSVPMEWDGDHLHAAITLDIQRMDWGSGVLIELTDATGTSFATTLRVVGGGQAFDLVYRVRRARLIVSKHRMTDALLNRTITITLTFSADEDWFSAAMTHPSGEVSRVVRDKKRPLPVAGPLTMSISPYPGAGFGLSQTLLRTITVQGATLRDIDPTPLQAAHHQLAINRPDRALAMLEAVPTEQARLARMIALLELNAPETARTFADLYRADPTFQGARRLLMLQELERSEPLFRATFGRLYYQRFWEAWRTVLAAHTAEDIVTKALTEHLDGLRELPLHTDTQAAMEELQLLRYRAGGLRRLGRLAEAEQDLAQVLQHIDTLQARPLPEAIASSVQGERARVWRERAMIALGRQEPDVAIDALLEALNTTIAPEILADQLWVDPGLVELHPHPGWAQISAARWP